jgi:hypothetical protein
MIHLSVRLHALFNPKLESFALQGDRGFLP